MGPVDDQDGGVVHNNFMREGGISLRISETRVWYEDELQAQLMFKQSLGLI